MKIGLFGAVSVFYNALVERVHFGWGLEHFKISAYVRPIPLLSIAEERSLLLHSYVLFPTPAASRALMHGTIPPPCFVNVPFAPLVSFNECPPCMRCWGGEDSFRTM